MQLSQFLGKLDISSNLINQDEGGGRVKSGRCDLCLKDVIFGVILPFCKKDKNGSTFSQIEAVSLTAFSHFFYDFP